MKKLVFAFSAILVLFLFSGCNQKKESDTEYQYYENEQTNTNVSTENNSTSTTANESSKTSKPTDSKKKDTIPSVVLYEDTPFYTENSSGKMVYADAAKLGEPVLLYVKGDEPEQKNAIRLLSSGKEEKFNFVHLEYDGNDYWTRDIFVTKHRVVVPALITEDTLIYESAEGTGATSKKLDFGTIVAADSVVIETDEDIGLNFIPVVIYNGTPFGREIYVKAEAVSKNASDVLFIQTISAIKASKNLNEDVKERLLYLLDSLSVSDAFTADVRKSLYESVLTPAAPATSSNSETSSNNASSSKKTESASNTKTTSSSDLGNEK
ncbi:MAG: hypothetical protein K6A43_12415 [Treponema sp.]|nr:hypothetical protein [Treponema sp.]